MRKLRYLWVSSRIPERNFHDTAQNNGVEQHSEQQSRKPSNQQLNFKESWKAYIRREWPTVEFIWVFLAGYTSSHEQYNINIYIQRITKLSTPIINTFVTLKVLIQNERTLWFTAQTLCSAFVQGIVIVEYSPSLPSFSMNSWRKYIINSFTV